MGWFAEWREEERVINAAYPKTRPDWRALWFTARWHLIKPLRKAVGRWRCAICSDFCTGALEDHPCPDEGP